MVLHASRGTTWRREGGSAPASEPPARRSEPEPGRERSVLGASWQRTRSRVGSMLFGSGRLELLDLRSQIGDLPLLHVADASERSHLLRRQYVVWRTGSFFASMSG
jgi:hypothetical protein